MFICDISFVDAPKKLLYISLSHSMPMIHPPPTARTWVLACLHICACMYECITHKSLALGLAPFIFFFSYITLCFTLYFFWFIF
jgi:hypothetical protein